MFKSIVFREFQMTIEAQFSGYRSCYYLPEVLNHIISKVHGFIRLILLTVRGFTHQSTVALKKEVSIYNFTAIKGLV